MSVQERQLYIDKIRDDPTFKGAFGRSLLKTLYDHQLSPNNTRNKICKEVFLNVPVVIYTRKDFYLLDRINEKIEFLKAGGLIEHWHQLEVAKGALMAKNLKIPQTFRIDELLSCFKILLLGCFVGLVFFIFEIIFPFLSPVKFPYLN